MIASPIYTTRVAGLPRTVRHALAVFVFLLIYDGALRKWVLPNAEQLLFILKDTLLAGLLTYVLVSRRQYSIAGKLPSLSAWLLFVYAGWVICETFNFNLPNIAVGLWGVKAHLLYAGLLLLVPIAFRDVDSAIRWCAAAYPWLVIPPAALAFIQVASPPESFLNMQVRGGLEMISYFGDQSLVRVAGPFSYISGMASFVQASTVLGTGLFIAGARSPKFLLGLFFALAAMPVTGSRAVLVVAAASVILMIAAGRASKLISLKTTAGIAGALFVLIVISFFAQDSAWTAIQERTRAVAQEENDTDRALTAFTNAFNAMASAGLVGFGSGATNFAAVALAPDVEPFSWLPIGQEFEEESGRIVLELGTIGWFLSLLMRTSFLLWSIATIFGGRTRSIRATGMLVMPTLALGVHAGSGVFAPPVAACYYWFCVALLAMARHEQRRVVSNPPSDTWSTR